jgi:hypothetical protein
MKRTCEVVERVGQAIFDKVCPGIRMKDADREVYKEAARAAIAAMSPADAVQIGDKVERIAGHRWAGRSRHGRLHTCGRLSRCRGIYGAGSRWRTAHLFAGSAEESDEMVPNQFEDAIAKLAARGPAASMNARSERGLRAARISNNAAEGASRVFSWNDRRRRALPNQRLTPSKR